MKCDVVALPGETQDSAAPQHCDAGSTAAGRGQYQAQPPDATVEVMAVVLEDGTALGEPQALKSIFDKRVVERDELRKVVETFNAVLPSKRGAAAIDDLKSRFSASSGAQESTPHRSAREAVDAFAQRAAAGKADEADQSLRTYAAFLAGALLPGLRTA